ncbi:Protein PRY1 [Hypsizygus marmoreus]|uniref:Protein PRY1 n=1 Tax=Hypsizygus marmoreus TaxID=39966 RepID=A0A369K3P5_HYPMA|nr:Protein PRY1 [Hypsizygus marmoreus]
MTRLIPFVPLALLATSLPGGLAGPACSRKYWKTPDCVQKCKSKWGWSGRMMGTDPWGNVMQKSDPAESWDVALAKACGSTAQISITQPVANVQTGTVPSSTPIVTLSPSVTSVTSPVGFAAATTSSSVSTKPSASTISTKSITTSVPPPPKTTSTTPPAFAVTTTRTPVIRTTTAPKPAPTTSTKLPALATTKPPASTPPPSLGGGSGSTISSDIEAYLSSHNSVRANHGAAPLTWSDDLAAKAQQWANGCVFEHSGGSLGSFGENLAAGTSSVFNIQAAVKSWTDEVKDYNAANPNPSHFTQVVWKATTQVGCAIQSCDGIFDASFGKAKYFVCEYSPAGNIIGRFAENVQA